MFQRSYIKILRERLAEPRKFIQVINGPRQVGKTRLVLIGQQGISWEEFLRIKPEELF